MARKTGGRVRAAIFLVISLMAAVVAALVIFRVMRSYTAALDSMQVEEEKIFVVTAANHLYQGDTIEEQDLVVKEIPKAFVPDTAFQKKAEVIGRVPTERILSGEYIREERLADPEAGIGLNAIIPQGMRAISININNASAVSGFLNPGNYVDVLITLESTDNESKTMTLEQAMLVLAVNNRMGEGPGQERQGERYRPSVTLAVTPEQAERITHANKSGTMTLTLRNDVDVTKVETHGASARRLIGTETAPAIPLRDAQTRRAPDGTMMIIRGGRETKLRVGPDGAVDPRRRR